MTENLDFAPYEELGKYIDNLHRTVKVDGEFLNVKKIATLCKMSSSTYRSVKKG